MTTLAATSPGRRAASGAPDEADTAKQPAAAAELDLRAARILAHLAASLLRAPEAPRRAARPQFAVRGSAPTRGRLRARENVCIGIAALGRIERAVEASAIAPGGLSDIDLERLCPRALRQDLRARWWPELRSEIDQSVVRLATERISVPHLEALVELGMRGDTETRRAVAQRLEPLLCRGFFQSELCEQRHEILDLLSKFPPRSAQNQLHLLELFARPQARERLDLDRAGRVVEALLPASAAVTRMLADLADPQRTQEAALRRCAIIALGRAAPRDLGVRSRIERSLSDPDVDVQIAAVTAAAQLRLESVHPQILALAELNTNPLDEDPAPATLKIAALLALSGTAPSAASDYLSRDSALYRLGAVLRGSGGAPGDDDPCVQEAAIRALSEWAPATPRDSSIAIYQLATSIETYPEFARIAIKGIRRHAENTNNWLSPVADLLDKLRSGDLARMDDAAWLRAELTSILLAKPRELWRHTRHLIPGLVDPNPGVRAMTLSAIRKGVDRPLPEDEIEALFETTARASRAPLEIQNVVARALHHVQSSMNDKETLAPLFHRLGRGATLEVKSLLHRGSGEASAFRAR